jgi:hypothetical protein
MTQRFLEVDLPGLGGVAGVAQDPVGSVGLFFGSGDGDGVA